MKRRTFLQSSAAGVLFASTKDLAAASAEDWIETIGLQLYTLRDALGKDPAGTLKAVADAGYQQVELYGFPNCKPLVDGAKAAGLAMNSSHFDWDCAVNPKDDAMSDFRKILDLAKETGLTDLVIPYLHEANRRTLDDYKKVAENCNKAAALSKEAGIRLAYHNHAFEFEPKQDGRSGFEVFVADFSADMGFELDVFWVKVGGVEPVGLIEKLAGRVTQLHLKDLKDGIDVPDFGSLPHDAFKELGAGVIPMPPILAAARKAGVFHCHVEQDHSPDALASIRQSAKFLRSL
jgi:sugar phosphate isomerase/epimerase